MICSTRAAKTLDNYFDCDVVSTRRQFVCRRLLFERIVDTILGCLKIGPPRATCCSVVNSSSPVCFANFCITSFSTMIPKVSQSCLIHGRGILLSVTCVADDPVLFFGIVGASFGPICGAMAVTSFSQPARRYSLIASFLVYGVLAKAGLEPRAAERVLNRNEAGNFNLGAQTVRNPS